MRTTLTIPDDALAAARQLAEAKGLPLGEAVGELIRQGVQADTVTNEFWRGVPLYPRTPGEPPMTLERVNRLRDELP